MDHREQGHGAGRRRRRGARGRLQRLELAPLCAVDHLPSARAQPLANAISTLEVLIPPALDALSKQLLGFFSA